MATSKLNLKQGAYDDGLDSVVIVKALTDLPGGRTLDVSGFAEESVIKSGHIIVADANGNHKPLAVSGGAYATPAEGETIVGVLKCSVLTTDPRAAIVTGGQINAAASPYPVTDAIEAALPNIQFLYK